MTQPGTKSVRLSFFSVHSRLFKAYGPQGWWPLPSMAGKRGFDSRGYHPGSYRWPRSARGRFEIILGAILTQNTAWTNVEMALKRLEAAGLELPEHFLRTPSSRLARHIRSSGYFNQKAKKLKIAAKVFSRPGALDMRAAPTREELLELWGSDGKPLTRSSCTRSPDRCSSWTPIRAGSSRAWALLTGPKPMTRSRRRFTAACPGARSCSTSCMR